MPEHTTVELTSAARALRKPPAFMGRQEEDPSQWIRRFDLLRRANRWDDETAITVVGSYMEGLAADWFFQDEDRVDELWVKFEQEFRARFVSPASEETWWDELENRRQGSTESVDEVAGAILKLLVKLRITDERLRVRYLLKALRPEIAQHVMRSKRDGTWENTVEQAKVEQTIQTTFQENSTIATQVGTPGRLIPGRDQSAVPTWEKDRRAKDPLEKISEEFEKLRIYVTKTVGRLESGKGPGGGSSSQVTCHRCQEQGHYARDCPRQQGKDKGRQ